MERLGTSLPRTCLFVHISTSLNVFPVCIISMSTIYARSHAPRQCCYIQQHDDTIATPGPNITVTLLRQHEYTGSLEKSGEQTRSFRFRYQKLPEQPDTSAIYTPQCQTNIKPPGRSLSTPVKVKRNFIFKYCVFCSCIESFQILPFYYLPLHYVIQ